MEQQLATICFITAIYGNYELTCKMPTKQTVDCDYICFTDNPQIQANGWEIDTRPYHHLFKSPLDNDTYVNSLSNNQHTFNVAKYYKCNWQNIPRLQKYKYVIWIDGTVMIYCPTTAAEIVEKLVDYDVLTMKHENRNTIEDEAQASLFFRYTSQFWNGQRQPVQNVLFQANSYKQDGYKNETPLALTCLIAFKNKMQCMKFLDHWYLQILKYSTQDQISFPFSIFKTNTKAYICQNDSFFGKFPHKSSRFYIKYEHSL